MKPQLQALVDYTRACVTAEQVVLFVPQDPGTPDYLRVWNGLLQSGEVPTNVSFELSEVIGGVGGRQPKDPQKAAEKRAFRRFASAVALALIHAGNDPSIVRPVNYLAHDLVVDCDGSEPEHLQLVRAMLLPTRDLLATTNYDAEFPFFTFAALLLALLSNDIDQTCQLAAQLIADEALARTGALPDTSNESQFLLGLSGYDQLHREWKTLASKLSNPTNDESMQLIIEAFANSKLR